MRTVDTRVVYRNRWMSVREDRIERADGTRGLYGVVDKPDFALVVPRDRDGFWLVEQYRYPVRRRAWEFPQGSWDVGSWDVGSWDVGSWDVGAQGAGCGPPTAPTELARAELARAELREETGLRARHIRRLGHLYAAYGFCSQGFDVFLATGLEPGEPAREASEQDMVHRFVADEEFVRMIGREIVDGATLAAYALLQVT